MSVCPYESFVLGNLRQTVWACNRSFGLKNAPSVLQQDFNCALGGLVYSYVVVYIDVIMVVAGTKDEAFERLKVVMQALTNSCW